MYFISSEVPIGNWWSSSNWKPLSTSNKKNIWPSHAESRPSNLAIASRIHRADGLLLCCGEQEADPAQTLPPSWRQFFHKQRRGCKTCVPLLRFSIISQLERLYHSWREAHTDTTVSCREGDRMRNFREDEINRMWSAVLHGTHGHGALLLIHIYIYTHTYMYNYLARTNTPSRTSFWQANESSFTASSVPSADHQARWICRDKLNRRCSSCYAAG